MNLPLANILHHKLRSLISAIGIGIAVCMLITLTGLSRGSLFEIAERMEAQMVVLPGQTGAKDTEGDWFVLMDTIAAALSGAAPPGEAAR